MADRKDVQIDNGVLYFFQSECFILGIDSNVKIPFFFFSLLGDLNVYYYREQNMSYYQ